ncbi:MAG: mechanosensitive ion channel family protein, partial [Candidatus Binataceae bacterium]
AQGSPPAARTIAKRGTSATPADSVSIRALAASSRATTMVSVGPVNSDKAAASASGPKSTTVAASAGVKVGPHSVIAYLGQAISWYRRLDAQARLAQEPAEVLFVADDRQMAREALSLAFDYARAQAALLKASGVTGDEESAAKSHEAGKPSQGAPAAIATDSAAVSSLSGLIAAHAHAEAEVDANNAKLKSMQQQLAHTRDRKTRDQINQRIVGTQGELELAQSRSDALGAMVEFQSDRASTGVAGAGLTAQIYELQRSVPEAIGGQSKVQPPAASAQAQSVAEPSGILPRVEYLLALQRKAQTISDQIDATNSLFAAVDRLRAPLIDEVRQVNRQGTQLAAQAASSDLAAIRRSKDEFEKLTARHKLIVAALLPLSKQMVILNVYASSLERWRDQTHQRFNEELHALALRLGGLAFLLVLVFAGAIVWRELTFRYVQDLQRRHQLLTLRRLTVIVIIALIVIFDFANELGSFATVMGFAAAGIALALQNVIMSLAGYFYVAGRFGIQVGDRVQISGVNGDVLEIGFFKMTLMELSKELSGRQPTGRIVVFPNSVVFQPNASFFKQVPGTSFTWNELRLTLAPDCDYRLAEKRLGEVVNQVFARYREAVQRQFHNMERDLNVRAETPRPQSRLQLGEAGIEIIIRYPVQLAAAVQTEDEISRRLVDAIKREPGLKLVSQGTPTIQAADSRAEAELTRSAVAFAPGGLPSAVDDGHASASGSVTAGAPGVCAESQPETVDQTVNPAAAAAGAAAIAAGVVTFNAVESRAGKSASSSARDPATGRSASVPGKS